MKNKAYRAFPLGQEAGAYLRQNRGRLLPNTYKTYESCLDKLARYFCDLELDDFEPPVGTERLEEFVDEQWGEQSARTRAKNICDPEGVLRVGGAPREAARRPDPADPAAEETRRPPDDILRRSGTGDRRRSTDRRDRLALSAAAQLGGSAKAHSRASSSATSTTPSDG